MSNPNNLPVSRTETERPNYTLRRSAAVGTLILASLGVWKGGELAVDGYTAAVHNISQTDYEQFNCQDGPTHAVVGNHETAWNAAGVPLANKLHIPVDQAMSILATANPNRQLGSVSAGSVVSIPDCKP